MGNSPASFGVLASTSTSEGDEDDIGDMGDTDRRSELEEVSTISVGGCDAKDDMWLAGGSIGETSTGDSERRSRYCSVNGLTNVSGVRFDFWGSRVGVGSSLSDSICSPSSRFFVSCDDVGFISASTFLTDRTEAASKALVIVGNMDVGPSGEAVLSGRASGEPIRVDTFSCPLFCPVIGVVIVEGLNVESCDERDMVESTLVWGDRSTVCRLSFDGEVLGET